MDAKEKALEIIKRLRKEYPELKTVLQFGNPFELLVATILSAQTTDVLVNKITGNLFRKYRTIKNYADAPPGTFQKEISSVNFYKTKAKNIQNTAKMLMEEFHATVPKTMEELIRLPGVARKTANIILFNAYGINEGIAVDTHVKRLAKRLGLTRNEDPVKIEQDLMKIIPKNQWGNITHLLIFHGRGICQARKTNHSECVLYEICPSRNI
ncbi:MAG: endonuclease III [Thermodesulfovibrionales bacterium]|nr:endonuclease III [Thermodesulfovibrionales bacterium]